MFGSSNQVVAQAPAPSIPRGWISLVDHEVPVEDVALAHDAGLDRNQPLANLRQQDPSGLLTETSKAQQIIGDTSYSDRQNRSTETLVAGWTQPGLRHRRLYFEDPQIERGNAPRKFPNVAAGANFVKSLVAFPIRLVTDRSNWGGVKSARKQARH